MDLSGARHFVPLAFSLCNKQRKKIGKEFFVSDFDKFGTKSCL